MTLNVKILARARKLLQVSTERGATWAEAQTAASLLQELLQQNALTLAHLEAPVAGDDRAVNTTERRVLFSFQRSLMTALAGNNFCLHRTTVGPTGDDQHVLVGTKLNVEVTLMSYDHLSRSLQAACGLAGYALKARDGQNFMEGAVGRVAERLHQRRRSAERASQANGSGRELVCLADVYGTEDDLNNDTLNGYPAGTTAQRRRAAAATRVRQSAQRQRYEDAGVDPAMALYMSWGYTPEAAMSLLENSRIQRRPRRRRGTGFTREDRAYDRKVSSPAYKRGRVAGEAVGLDMQLNAKEE